MSKTESKDNASGKTYKITQILVKEVPKKAPTVSDTFEIKKDIIIGPLKDNEILIETEYLSVDPYQRFRLNEYIQTNKGVPYNFCVAKIIESKNNKYNVGEYVYGTFSWQSLSIINPDSNPKFINKCPPDITGVTTKHDIMDDNTDDSKGNNDVDLTKLDKRYFIGAMGMPSQTAYFGLINKAEIKKGETVVVSGAAGAVGSIVGQIAKQIYGCTVVGLAGSKSKCDWLVNELGFDGAVNYKLYPTKTEMQNAIKKAINNDAKKVDIYFDNVGGLITESIWDLLGWRARVIICGQIAHYNEGERKKTYNHLFDIIYREISVKGLIVSAYVKEYPKFYKDMGRWILSGKFKVKDTIINGIDNAPQAFCGLFTGKNIGKMVVKCT
mmetsp:Transcript_35607/g.43991  ORF Transcript_35607/g.43991 Transcript_35607/m.43991 type:complete len:383 (+) Transcript_35607:47-1195(+)